MIGGEIMDIISRLKFDPKCIGTDLLALSSKPVYVYENGKRVSDEVVAFKYELLCPTLGYEKLSVKIDASAKQLNVSEDNPLEVELIGLEMSPVWTPNGYIVRATAKGIKTVGKTER